MPTSYYFRDPNSDVLTGKFSKMWSSDGLPTNLSVDKDVEGLQFLKDGKWYKAPIVPDNSDQCRRSYGGK
ncbi:hypothetical protein F2Q68_00000706 [Brassica cretica]|uniref:Uncharacterized protein n=2 Tax=Brassica cretica TaxID=69181 RepID=A0A8S9JFA7_BRACR|nr:hypothetical protein F2Q68_00000706 [Brassica cretica]KAF3542453.1 hypothetical protein DY000_02000897 [Brassica cretica]